jgi:hypothetical protein
LTAGIDGAWCDAPASSGRAWLRRSPRSIGRLAPRFPAEGWRRGSAAIARNFPVRCGRRCSSNRWVETSDEEPIATLPSGRGAGGRPGADWRVFYEVTNNVSRHLWQGCGNLGGDRMRTTAKWGANSKSRRHEWRESQSSGAMRSVDATPGRRKSALARGRLQSCVWLRATASAFRGTDQGQDTSKSTREGEGITGSLRRPKSRGAR